MRQVIEKFLARLAQEVREAPPKVRWLWIESYLAEVDIQGVLTRFY